MPISQHPTPGRAATLEEIKNSQLDMLYQFASFCTQHQLSFALTYGTLIGAARHDGYIPWDDDIDIAMPWLDYKRFCNIISTQHQGYLGPYRVADPLVPHPTFYHAFFMKIYDDRMVAQQSELKTSLHCKESVFIDVFPQIALSMDKETAATDPRIERLYDVCCSIFNKVFSWRHISYRHPRQALYTIAEMLKTTLDGKSFNEYLTEYHALMDELDTQSDGASFLEPASLWCSKNIFIHNLIGNTVLHPFEHLMLPIPQNYDEVLAETYGDWRTLPPIEAQKPSHAQEFIWQS